MAKDGESAGGFSIVISIYLQSGGSVLFMPNTANCFFASCSIPQTISKPTCVSKSLATIGESPSLLILSSNQTVNIMRSVYGMEIKGHDDPFYEIAEVSMHSLSMAGIFGTFYVDFIPILKHLPRWIPGAGFRRLADDWGRYVRRLRDDGFMTLRKKMVRDDRAKIILVVILNSTGAQRGTAMHWKGYARWRQHGGRKHCRDHWRRSGNCLWR